MTLREGFEKALEDYERIGNAEMVEFFKGRLAQVEKKATAVRKPTPHQIENESFKADILAWMDADTVYSAADVLKGVPSIVESGMSVNRVSALLTQLCESGAVTKSVDKRKNFYSLA